ncbi:polysaccharide biosynthesis C-terminal domain-containing protein [Halosimplex pelagicum]|uniref:Polysaccharide biosynthesis C-terminal domain-containing protein n=1 Tax=Halosimplex pelagicum TaxID=869886 RepID=A0A7D5PD67_9EURY|nr:polysaccharide biosynthesis C-terminal domain-containing protein [Halosimplex pelagicum]QLH83862.1 polysaccharide biosynthesis C-terminal domain-containing protein [Halosimplex pelagicum]
MQHGRTAVLHFLAQVVRSLAGFGTTLFAARYFGAAGLGVYSQFLALLFWVKLPGDSMTSAVSKRMSEDERTVGHFSAGLLVVLGYGVVVGLAVSVLQGPVNDFLGVDAALLLVALVAINMAFDLVKSGFVGDKRVAVSGWLGTAEQVLRLGGQVAFVVLGGAMVLGLVYGHILSLFAFALIGLFLLRDRLAIPTRSDLTELRTFAQYSWLGNLKGLALNWMDILVLGVFVGDGLVGIYTASWTLASFLTLASKSIATTLFPQLSDLGSRGDFEKARELVTDAMLFSGVFLIPGGFGAAVLGSELLQVYSAEFATGGTILVILIGARLFHAFGGQFIGALNGLDYPELAFRINAVFFSTNFVLNVVLVYLYGWYGAAAATLLSTVVYVVLGWRLLTRKVGAIRVPYRAIGHQVFASAVMAAVVWTVRPATPNPLYVTIALVAVGAAVYGAVLVVISAPIRGKLRALADLD